MSHVSSLVTTILADNSLLEELFKSLTYTDGCSFAMTTLYLETILDGITMGTNPDSAWARNVSPFLLRKSATVQC